MARQTKASPPDFSRENRAISELLDRVAQIVDLTSVLALANWDQNTAMSDGAVEMRGNHLATLQGLLHELWTAERLCKVLEQLGDVQKEETLTDADKGLVREARRGYERATKLPHYLVQELARVRAASFDAWHKARSNNDFAFFAPWLQRTISLQREVADHLGYEETRYDALLDQFEPGMRSSRLDCLFTPVRQVSIHLLKGIEARKLAVDSSCLEGDFDVQKQIELSKAILRNMGYQFTYGGIAVSPHPFTASFGSPFDVRLTVRPDPCSILPAVMAAIHEGGHALYEQGIAPTLARTALAGGVSMGMHESQSRLWENSLGRSLSYWQGQYPLLRATFPEHFARVDVEAFTCALNRVQPSLIRVEADEVSYNLHILIRYEMEQAMINGEVAVESLPGLWSAKYRDYLGIEPESDSHGILQDGHWSAGFGYFPSYTLGNLYAAQIFQRLHRVFPDFDERLGNGETGFVLRWLQENMYSYGATYMPEELIKRVTGEPLNPDYFVTYLSDKFTRTYQLS